LWIAVLAAAPAAAGDSALTTARELYVAAQYREALDLLAQTSLDTLPASSQPLVHEYRALCLLALNREEEGVHAFEALLQARPDYEPEPDSLSPRIRVLFDATRRRLLPGMAKARFEAARAAFDRGEYITAAKGFETVKAILSAAHDAGAPIDGASDLSVLADGFRELAASRVGPAPARRLTVAIARAPSVDASGAAPDVPAAAEAINPPVVVRQDVPRWPAGLARPATAVALLQVEIDSTGAVTAARLIRPLHPIYDQLLVEAARDWRYRPALRNGQPTPYVKTLRIELVP
jgi:protein TonB